MQTDQRVDQNPLPGTAQAGAVTKTPTDARQGVKLGVMRYVLGISIALAIVGVAIAYWIA
jgi:hypothetical protein